MGHPAGILFNKSGINMTYNIQAETVGIFSVGLTLADNTSLSSGDAVPYAIEAGTSSHGFSVSNGVITLPKGDWLVMFSLEAMSAADHTAKIYVDSSLASNFPVVEGFYSSQQSDLDTTAIPVFSSGGTTVELRVDTASNVNYSSSSDCVVYGVKIS